MKADKLIETIRTYQEKISWIFGISSILILSLFAIIQHVVIRSVWMNYIWVLIIVPILFIFGLFIEIDRLNYELEKRNLN